MLRLLIIGVAVAALAAAYPQPAKPNLILDFLNGRNKKDNNLGSHECKLCEDDKIKENEIEDLGKKIKSVNGLIETLQSNNTKFNDEIEALLATVKTNNYSRTNLHNNIVNFQTNFETSYKILFELEYEAIKLKNDVIYREFMVLPLDVNYEDKINKLELSKLKIHQLKEEVYNLKLKLEQFFNMFKKYRNTFSFNDTNINELKEKISPITTRLQLESSNIRAIEKQFDEFKNKTRFDVNATTIIEDEKKIVRKAISTVEDKIILIEDDILTLKNGISKAGAIINIAEKDMQDTVKTFDSIRENIKAIEERAEKLKQELNNEKHALKLISGERLSADTLIKRLEITSNYGEFYLLSKILPLEYQVELLEAELKSQNEKIKHEIKLQNMKIEAYNEAINLKLQEFEKPTKAEATNLNLKEYTNATKAEATNLNPKNADQPTKAEATNLNLKNADQPTKAEATNLKLKKSENATNAV